MQLSQLPEEPLRLCTEDAREEDYPISRKSIESCGPRYGTSAEEGPAVKTAASRPTIVFEKNFARLFHERMVGQTSSQVVIREEYSNGEYLRKNPTFHVEDSPWKAGQIMRAVRAYRLSPFRVAEVGCGAGEILARLAPHMPDSIFFGYEMSPQGFGLCQSRKSERIAFANTDFLESEEVFDLVLCIDVFEHVEDCLGFLRRLRERGRKFLFHVPLDMNVQMVLRSRPLLGVRASVGHLHYFSRETALATIADAGFRIIGSFYTPNGADQPKSARARALQIPRKVAYAFTPDLTARVLGGYSLMVCAE